MTIDLSGLSPMQANAVLCAVECAAWHEYVTINQDLADYWSGVVSPAKTEMEGWRDAAKVVSQRASDLRKEIK